MIEDHKMEQKEKEPVIKPVVPVSKPEVVIEKVTEDPVSPKLQYEINNLE